MPKEPSGHSYRDDRHATAVCQVCNLDLAAAKVKVYCLKKRVCPLHLQAESVYLPGNDAPMRFCQQCGKFEPVSAFDGAKRSCRLRTAQRRVKPFFVPEATSGRAGSSWGDQQEQQQQLSVSAGHAWQPAPSAAPAAAAAATLEAAAAAGSSSWGHFSAARAPSSSVMVMTGDHGQANGVQLLVHAASDASAAAAAAAAGGWAPAASVPPGQPPHPPQPHPQQQLRSQQQASPTGPPALGASQGGSSKPPLAGLEELLLGLVQSELQKCRQQRQALTGHEDEGSPFVQHPGPAMQGAVAGGPPEPLAPGPPPQPQTAAPAAPQGPPAAAAGGAAAAGAAPGASNALVDALRAALCSMGGQQPPAGAPVQAHVAQEPAPYSAAAAAAEAVVRQQERMWQARQQLVQQVQVFLEEERLFREVAAAAAEHLGGVGVGVAQLSASLPLRDPSQPDGFDPSAVARLLS